MPGALRLMTLVMLVMIGLGACGPAGRVEGTQELTDPDPGEPHDTATPNSDPGSTPAETIVEWVSLGWSSFVHWSDAAVIGEVTAISDPTSVRGKNDDEGVPAQRARYATVRVDRTIYASDNVSAGRGEELQVLLWGDGTDTGDRVAGAAVERWNAISGPVRAGDRVLWVLTRGGTALEGESEPPILLQLSYLGNWRIQGEQAVNANPPRSLPTEELTRLLQKERASEHRPDDPRGKGDPREGAAAGLTSTLAQR